MICHEHKCIFIHIPRTAGSSVEQWICGQDWWDVDPPTKHLTASQAKARYADHWDDYFKFSIVRNPWARMMSCLAYPDYFGVKLVDGTLDFTGYEQRFGTPLTLEIDYRFHQREEVLRKTHTDGRVYLNVLDEPLDFVGRFEHLEKDTALIAERLVLATPFRVSTEAAPLDYRRVFNDDALNWVAKSFRDDIAKFSYAY
tara:strand:- start:13340 stop:13936 length:597 start_codon:yes stop_codon:yes gene_type:complete